MGVAGSVIRLATKGRQMEQHDASRTPPPGAQPHASGRIRRGAKRVLVPVVAFVATLYFLIDALFLWFLRPIADWLGRLRILEGIRAWIQSLGPYPTLALFLVPLIILEPVKPATWTPGFFDRIRIDDPAFARPSQGPIPPAPQLG